MTFREWHAGMMRLYQEAGETNTKKWANCMSLLKLHTELQDKILVGQLPYEIAIQLTDYPADQQVALFLEVKDMPVHEACSLLCRRKHVKTK